MKKTGLILILSVLGAVLLCSEAMAATADPYQDVTNETNVKTYFLRRISNDIKPGDPPFVIAGYETPDLSKLPVGKFFLANNSSQLDEAFKNVAKKIKLRLVG